MDREKEVIIDEILCSLDELGETVIRGDFAPQGILEPFLLLWTLKKMCVKTHGSIARDRAFDKIEEGLGGDKIYLRQNDIEYVLGTIEKSLSIKGNTLIDRFRPSSYAFEKLYALNDSHNIKTPFYKLDITSDEGDIYEYLFIKNLARFSGINPKVAEVAARILKLKDWETFSDFMSGTALTTEIITKGKDNVDLILADNYPNAYALSALYLFLTDRKGKAIYEDSISEENIESGLKADKVFVTPQRGKKLPGVKYNGMFLSEIAYAAVIKAAYTLKEHGKAVLSLTSSFAFGTKYYGEEIRKYLVKNNYVSAVILLPNLYKFLNTPNILLVLSKDEKSDILMVDLTHKEKDEDWFYYEKSYETLSLRDKAVEKIEILERERKEEEGISILVDKERVRENAYNLLPSFYIENKTATFRSLEEINKDIEGVIKELKDLLDRVD